jgi:hypothetical protein
MTNERLSSDQTPLAILSRNRDLALAEAEAAQKSGWHSAASHSYGQSVAYAEAIRIVTAAAANLRTPTGAFMCSRCAPDTELTAVMSEAAK